MLENSPEDPHSLPNKA